MSRLELLTPQIDHCLRTQTVAACLPSRDAQAIINRIPALIAESYRREKDSALVCTIEKYRSGAESNRCTVRFLTWGDWFRRRSGISADLLDPVARFVYDYCVEHDLKPQIKWVSGDRIEAAARLFVSWDPEYLRALLAPIGASKQSLGVQVGRSTRGDGHDTESES